MIAIICWFGPWKLILTTVINHQSQAAIQFSERIAKYQSGLCKHYEDSGFFTLNLEPWKISGGKHVHLKSNYIKQTFQNFEGHTSENLFEHFIWIEDAKKNFLLVAEEGEGKTTAIKYATYEWCNSVLESEYQNHQKLKYQVEYLMGKQRVPLQESPEPVWWNSIWKMISNKIIQQLLHYLTPKAQKPLPEVVFALDLKNICSSNSHYDDLRKESTSIRELIEKISDRIILIFDGYEEFIINEDCPEKIKLEVESMIKNGSHNMYKIIVTSRSWKLNDLLSIQENNYGMLTFVQNEMTLELRNTFIRNFFSNMNEDLSEVMISALDSKKNIVPPKLFLNKGMLLYICKIYTYNFDRNSIEDFYCKEKFLNNLSMLRQLTHNKILPVDPITMNSGHF